MNTNTLIALGLLVGVVGVGFYIATRGGAMPTTILGGGESRAPTDVEQASGMVSAVGGAIGDVLGGVGSLIGNAYGGGVAAAAAGTSGGPK